MNDFVSAYNRGGDISGAEQPAIDALTHSADTVEGDSNGPLSQKLREALNGYDDAAREVANAIRGTRRPINSIKRSVGSTTPRPKP